MIRRAFACCAIATVVALSIAVGVVFAAGQPAGVPDLSQMVLQQKDFASTKVTSQGYQASPDFVAVYDRKFGLSKTTTGARFVGVFSEVDLTSSANEAQTGFVELNSILRSSAGRKLIVSAIVNGSGKHISQKNVRLGSVRSIATADNGLLLPIRLKVVGIPFSADFIVVQRGSVVGFLLLVSMPGQTIRLADATALANAMTGHIGLGLRPQNTGLPTITGTASPGQTLTAATGAWLNSPTAFTYEWQRCDASGSACAPISGATGTTYTVSAADVGSTIRVSVTAGNGLGSSAPALSAPTAVVH
jgi:hypothetical protein